MTQEEKELLLKDLSARLPYKVECEAILNNGGSYPCILDIGTLNWHISGDHVLKPYLRPMSSMTEEEVIEFEKICKFKCYPKHLRGAFFDNDCTPFSTGDVDYEYRYIRTEDVIECIDWLNKKMFAYRTINGKDMFELGIALKAPEGMYK